jgi:malonyl-CoA decarboxylase
MAVAYSRWRRRPRLVGFIRDLRNRLRPSRFGGAGTSDELQPGELDALRVVVAECVREESREAVANARAAAFAGRYLTLAPPGRQAILELLAGEFGCSEADVTEAARAIVDATTPASRRLAMQAARSALEPPWGRLLDHLSALPGGTKLLADIRSDLLGEQYDDPNVTALEEDIKARLVRRLDTASLELRRITWDAPASLLERLAQSEAVHEVAGWDDLKNRLDPDRRFFAFFHPCMPEEPLVFVEVALLDRMADNIAPLLDPKAPLGDPEAATTAIFYAISATQQGLAGISFGGILIKQVVAALRQELPRIKTFATLSPIPGFRAWLERHAEGDVLLPSEREALVAVGADPDEVLQAAAARAVLPEPPLAVVLRRPLLRLAAEYVLTAKRADGRALDPVANFHLTNGARVERLNWLADLTPAGMRASLGIMINYGYGLGEIERNHDEYSVRKAVAAATAVRRLAQAS